MLRPGLNEGSKRWDEGIRISERGVGEKLETQKKLSELEKEKQEGIKKKKGVEILYNPTGSSLQ